MTDHDPLCPQHGHGPLPFGMSCGYCELIVVVEQRIATAIAFRYKIVSDEMDAKGWDSYYEGLLDAYDISEQIALNGGSNGTP